MVNPSHSFTYFCISCVLLFVFFRASICYLEPVKQWLAEGELAVVPEVAVVQRRDIDAPPPALAFTCIPRQSCKGGNPSHSR